MEFSSSQSVLPEGTWDTTILETLPRAPDSAPVNHWGSPEVPVSAPVQDPWRSTPTPPPVTPPAEEPTAAPPQTSSLRSGPPNVAGPTDVRTTGFPSTEETAAGFPARHSAESATTASVPRTYAVHSFQPPLQPFQQPQQPQQNQPQQNGFEPTQQQPQSPRQPPFQNGCHQNQPPLQPVQQPQQQSHQQVFSPKPASEPTLPATAAVFAAATSLPTATAAGLPTRVSAKPASEPTLPTASAAAISEWLPPATTARATALPLSAAAVVPTRLSPKPATKPTLPTAEPATPAACPTATAAVASTMFSPANEPTLPATAAVSAAATSLPTTTAADLPTRVFSKTSKRTNLADSQRRSHFRMASTSHNSTRNSLAIIRSSSRANKAFPKTSNQTNLANSRTSHPCSLSNSHSSSRINKLFTCTNKGSLVHSPAMPPQQPQAMPERRWRGSTRNGVSCRCQMLNGGKEKGVHQQKCGVYWSLPRIWIDGHHDKFSTLRNHLVRISDTPWEIVSQPQNNLIPSSTEFWKWNKVRAPQV